MMNLAELFFSLIMLFPALPDDNEKKLDMRSEYVASGLSLSIKDKYITYYGFHLTGSLKTNTGGSGVLEVNPNGPLYDEFGFFTQANDQPLVRLDCTFKFVKKGIMSSPVEKPMESEVNDVEWALFELKGPKITSKLLLALQLNEGDQQGRLLVRDDQGKVKTAIVLFGPDPRPLVPCHPGCFPIGTKIGLGKEAKAIETIRVGDSIATYSKNGVQSTSKVSAIFVTKNRLLEVRTENNTTLVTTETQPLSLASGELKAAGVLKKGDKILYIVAGIKVQVNVKEVVTTRRYEPVYNLVLGEPTLFIANGFLARSKPPAVLEASK